MNIFLLLLAILPGFVICFLIIRADRFEKEPKWLMALAFIFGALITYPTMLVEGLATNLGWEESGNFFKVFFFALLFVGLIEEFFKFICLALPYFRKEFNEPLDGIVYAVLIAMGFATLENIIYADRFGISTVALRAFTAVPAHGAFAVIMGYYVGLSKVEINTTEKIKLILFGLGIASFLHGLYDFFIIQNYAEWLMSLATLVLIFSIYLAYRMLIILKNSSTFHPDNIAITEIPIIQQKEVEEIPDKDLPDEIPKAHDDVLFSAIDSKTEEE